MRASKKKQKVPVVAQVEFMDAIFRLDPAGVGKEVFPSAAGPHPALKFWMCREYLACIGSGDTDLETWRDEFHPTLKAMGVT